MGKYDMPQDFKIKYLEIVIRNFGEIKEDVC